MIINEEVILYKTKHKQVGRRYEHRIYNKNHPDTPKDVESIVDLGFLGIEKYYRNKCHHYPLGRRKGIKI